MADNVYVSPPSVCERLDDCLSRFGGTRHPLTSTTSAEGENSRVEYPLPAHASAEMRSYLEPLTTLESEPDFIARLPGGRVFGPGIVLAPDGRSLARDVSEDLGKAFGQHWLLTYAKMRPPVRVPGSTAVVAVTLGKGYCHWLLEELPRLLVLNHEYPDIRVIAHLRAPFIREAAEFGRFSTRIVEARRYSHFECEELIVPSLLGGAGKPTPRVADSLAEFTAPLRDRAVRLASGERLYVSREKAARRRVANEHELWPRLEALGFTKAFPEELSWKEQINAFSRAKVVVAPHGAGLANLAFCPPGVRVIELFNRAYVNPCFWRLAGIKGLDYRPIVSSGEERLAYDPKANRDDIHADVDAITKALIQT